MIIETTLNNKIVHLAAEVKSLNYELMNLKECIQLLSSDCQCTIKERISGHLVDCPVPHVKDLLLGDRDE